MANGLFGWVHLQDFGPEWWEHRDWSSIRECILRELQGDVRDDCGLWCALCLTGNMTRTGTPAEFNKLDEELKILRDGLASSASTPRLFVVPGNRDLVRPGLEHGAIVDILRHHAEHADVEHALWVTKNQLLHAPIQKAFTAYTEWLRKNFLPFTGIMPGDFYSHVMVNDSSDMTVGVVGLNSVALQLGEGVYESGLLHPRQFESSGLNIGKSWFQEHIAVLLLTRHAPDKLTARSRTDYSGTFAPQGRFARHLHGGNAEPFQFSVGGFRIDEPGAVHGIQYRYSVQRGQDGVFRVLQSAERESFRVIRPR